jgi:cysteinyl-tRNA synthetase
MNWDSPCGKGFPGWHVECSAMSIAHLGEEFDIHCGGVDHIPVHHTNERAQNIAAIGKPAVRFWMHGEFLVLKQGRMGKSEGNIITLQELVNKGFSPLAYRYLALGAHYRSKLTFSFEALEGAENSLGKLYARAREMKRDKGYSGECGVCFARAFREIKGPAARYKKRFLESINNDLNMPEALAVVWEAVKDKGLKNNEKYELLLNFDQVLGLGFDKIRTLEIPDHVQELIDEREEYRKRGDFEKADDLRRNIEKMGFRVEDTEKGPAVRLITNN